MPEVPLYVTSRINQLTAEKNANPISFYTSLGVSYLLKRPSITFVPEYDQTRGGWRIDTKAGTRIVRSENVQPPAAPPAPAQPPINIDPQSPIPDPGPLTAGNFLLTVENIGLPLGYAAPTRIRSVGRPRVLEEGDNNFIPRNVRETNIHVPFRGSYTLPVFDENDQKIEYMLSTPASITTPAGEYRRADSIPAINGQSGDAQNITITWSRNEPATVQMRPITVPPAVSLAPVSPAPAAATLPSSSFIPSNLPQRPAPNTLAPSLYTLSASIDPVDVFRATSISQMVSVASNNSMREYIYQVGMNEQLPVITYKVRNNTTNTPIRLTITTPSFIIGPSEMTVAPATTSEFSISLDYSDVIEASIRPTRNFEELLTWRVEPQNVTGPVFVKRNLPPVSFE